MLIFNLEALSMLALQSGFFNIHSLSPRQEYWSKRKNPMIWCQNSGNSCFTLCSPCFQWFTFSFELLSTDELSTLLSIIIRIEPDL